MAKLYSILRQRNARRTEKLALERLFDFPDIGPLTQGEARQALREPAQNEGADFTDDALDEVFRLTQGYPSADSPPWWGDA